MTLLLSGNKTLLKKNKIVTPTTMLHVVKKDIYLCFLHPLHELIMEPTKTKKHFKTLIYRILINSREKVTRRDANQM